MLLRPSACTTAQARGVGRQRSTSWMSKTHGAHGHGLTHRENRSGPTGFSVIVMSQPREPHAYPTLSWNRSLLPGRFPRESPEDQRYPQHQTCRGSMGLKNGLPGPLQDLQAPWDPLTINWKKGTLKMEKLSGIFRLVQLSGRFLRSIFEPLGPSRHLCTQPSYHV